LEDEANNTNKKRKMDFTIPEQPDDDEELMNLIENDPMSIADIFKDDEEELDYVNLELKDL
jgi:hypothetical protein